MGIVNKFSEGDKVIIRELKKRLGTDSNKSDSFLRGKLIHEGTIMKIYPTFFTVKYKAYITSYQHTEINDTITIKVVKRCC